MVYTCLHSQEVTYPYPIKYISLSIENQEAKMAFMDISANNPNGEIVLLLHGKNFSGFYWKDVIPALSNAGYRVVVPDQLGWGRSSKPNLHYNFHMLANNTKLLLDSLGIQAVSVVGHSMGGCLPHDLH